MASGFKSPRGGEADTTPLGELFLGYWGTNRCLVLVNKRPSQKLYFWRRTDMAHKQIMKLLGGRDRKWLCISAEGVLVTLKLFPSLD